MSEPRLPASVQTLPEAIAYWANLLPDAPALIASGEPAIGYGELGDRVRQVADALAEFGMQRNDCVLIMAPDGPSMASAFLGAASAAVAFALDPETPAAELEELLSRLSVGAAVVSAGVSAPVREALARRHVLVLSFDDGTILLEQGLVRKPAVSWQRPLPSDIATISRTSGTTGRSKLVPREHGRIVSNGRDHRDLFGLACADRAVAVAPMSLSLGKTVLLHSVCAGASLVFPSSFAPSQVWRSIEEERSTWMHASAGFLELLAQYLRTTPKSIPASLRFVRVTAAAITPALCEELEQYLGAPVLPSYSTSETGMVATTFARNGWRRPGSAGRPVQEIRIVDHDGREVAAGVEGEILIRGKKVVETYLDDSELNRRAFLPDGWLRIGDMGYLDEDGFLFLTGRVNELINRGGFKISPAEVDAALLTHPAVKEAAAFSVPDDRLGEDIVVAVILEYGQTLSPRQLRGWMLDRLASSKVPRRVWMYEEASLPRTPSGKVRRAELTRKFTQVNRAPIQK